MPVGKLASGLTVTRPAVSQHLKVLREAGLVAEHQEGSLQIVLLPGGKAEFHPQLSPRP